MSAQKIRECVEQELFNVLFCSTADFVHNLLGVPLNEEVPWTSVIDEVINSTYNETRERWGSFPDKGSIEAAYYKPFVDLANKVCQECQSVRKDQDALDGRWVDTHSKSPRERSNNTSRIQPDIVHVAFSESFEKATRSISEAASPEDKKIKKQLQYLWQQIHVAVEVKKDEPTASDLNAHVLQLCSYMRQMFQEQLDRRFIISMLLCGDQLYLLFLDRTGLVGTWDRLDIHKEPRRFIQILAAISLLPAQKLGWDPTMALYIDGDSIPSYRLPERKRGSPESNLFRDNWIISMPTKNKEREKFLTVRLVDGAAAQMLCSRATVVWEVIKLRALPTFTSKKGKKDRSGAGATGENKIHVLKQTWQQIGDQCTEPEEAKMYNNAKQDGFIASAEFVHVDGLLSSTLNFRNSVKYLNATLPHLGVKSKSQTIRDGNVEPFHDTDTLAPLETLLTRQGSTVERVQTRLLMEESGYPLAYSVSCLELINVLRDCIQMHKQIYLYGVLHRDISPGNLLIKDDGKGQLIDLDHAKCATNMRQALKVSEPESVPDPRLEKLQSVLDDMRLHVDMDSRKFILQYYNNYEVSAFEVAVFMKNIISHRIDNLNVHKRITMKDLGWPKEVQFEVVKYSISFSPTPPPQEQREDYKKLPNFLAKEAQGEIRTGTMRFMSWQVLLKQGTPTRSSFVHEAYHDIESFFWILVYICMTQEGPGGGRRLELQDKRSELSQIVHTAFNSDPEKMERLGRTRREYIANDKLEELIGHFHKDFCDLSELVESWWEILAYTSLNTGPDRDFIHHHALRLLDETISKLEKRRPLEEEDIERAKKEKRRERWASKRVFPVQRSGMANSTRAAKKRNCQT
ncbi:hypothetical protein AMATHDRAFT_42601 [Amanita thiersii Skay4041]|uniref:Fungal-type protein kinase domain-containing protein n=1 Tax=Amanita thiersii Skay4041 TaxID=703135 RepID=A0A2A9NAC4_9AGAR|nr:hypothetical protein AMATHDRAFT_42601 [Amanita thiersii Skay4041]